MSTTPGMAEGMLREIARLLDALARDPGFIEAIDLHSLPVSDADRAWLRQRLGRGEVEATFNLGGPTRIEETSYAGVWWIRHADADEHTVLEQIVVARVPALLLADTVDVTAAARRLGSELEGAAAPGEPS
ncbi:MAG: hypothetical protein JNN03_09520 [Rubrivivax sp.]|nr:hypothetical protein [Rubrivivax sp.]